MAGTILASASCARTEPERRAPVGADIRLPREFDVIEATVPPRATLDGLLRAHQLREDLVGDAVSAARAVFDPRHLRAGQPYRLVRSIDGLLREFEYAIDADQFLRIAGDERDKAGALNAQVLKYDKQTAVAAIDARIDAGHSSLIAAIDAAGEALPLAMDLADIFSGEVDFRTELQPGDSFRVLFEKASRDGQFSNYGAILGASISVAGRRLDALGWSCPRKERRSARTRRAGR